MKTDRGRRRVLGAFAGLCLSLRPSLGAAAPDEGEMLDVTRPPYNARGDGKADDTQALLRCLNDAAVRGGICYLPDGTYLVSGALTGGANPANHPVRIQGQSERETVIQFKDSLGFVGPLLTLAGDNSGDGLPANRIASLTLNTGKNNPAAIGIRFGCGKNGSFEDVTVRSGDGSGSRGLDIAAQTGPTAPLRHLTIEGFDTGIFAPQCRVVFEQITLRRQNRAGIVCIGASALLRQINSRNAVPVLVNLGNSQTQLADSDLSGGSDALPAILNPSGDGQGGTLRVHNVRTQGYTNAISDKGENIPGTVVTDYSPQETPTADRRPNRSAPATEDATVPQTPEPARMPSPPAAPDAVLAAAGTIDARQKKRAAEIAAVSSGGGWAHHQCSLFVGKNIAEANAYFVKNAASNATGTWRWGVTGLLRTYFQFGDTLLSEEAKASILAVCEKARNDNPWSTNGSNPQNWPWGNSENKQLTSLAVHMLVEQARKKSGPRSSAAHKAVKEQLTGILREGASEFNSPHYSSQTLHATLLLAEFCADPAIRELARMVTDQYLVDIAVESVRGVRGGPYFRGYEREIFDGRDDDAVYELGYFFFGNGQTATATNSAHWITTTHRTSPVIVELGTRPDEKGEYVQALRSRFGREGICSFTFYLQPGFSLASVQNHVRHVDDATEPSHANQVWEFTTDDPKIILGAYKKVRKNPESLHTANMQYRNVLFFAGDFMDYNKNLPNHETEKAGEKALHFWRVPTWDGDAFIGITHFPGANGGILEVRPGKEFASFDTFKDAIRKAPSSCADWGRQTGYTSTRGDVIRYDQGRATVNGKPFAIADYPRYEGPFVTSAWGDGRTRITFNGKSLLLDYRDPETPRRTETATP